MLNRGAGVAEMGVLNPNDYILEVPNLSEVWLDVTGLDEDDADSLSQEIYRDYEVDDVYTSWDEEEQRETRVFHVRIGSLNG